MDRIDLHVEVTPVPFAELSNKKKSETSAEIRTRVIAAREIQAKRFEKNAGVYCNAQMSSKLQTEFCVLNEASAAILKVAMEKLGLSARAYDRILRVARTIADLEKENNIETHHIAEAVQYRSLDRDGWAG